MVLAKKKEQNSGLGKALIADKFGEAGKGETRWEQDEARAMHSTLTTEDESPWAQLRSITQQTTLAEFMLDAELSQKAFTSDRTRRILNENDDQVEPIDDNIVVELQNRLTIPRPPKYQPHMSANEMAESQRLSFLEWRRNIASFEESEDASKLEITPYEKNIDIWRQLWRVLEMSDLVVQIVDARDPEFCRVKDLEKVVEKGRTFLLINKSDYLNDKQRRIWADYLTNDLKHDRFAFFSAVLSTDGNPSDDAPRQVAMPTASHHLYNVDQIVARLEQTAAKVQLKNPEKGLVTIGLVGYPNVGKSSTINALIRRKKVAISATPGKTKRYQTIHLTPTVMLCDCPGLVFPRLATTIGEMVCQGILPIDELRDVRSPVRYVLDRIPVHVLERIYGFTVPERKDLDGNILKPTMDDVLDSLANARGFMRGGSDGAPDQNRIARIILKDFVRGKLLYVSPPPTFDPTPEDFPQQYSHSTKLAEKVEEQRRQENGSVSIQSTRRSRSHDPEKIRMLELQMEMDKKMAIAAQEAGVAGAKVNGNGGGFKVKGKVLSPFARVPNALDPGQGSRSTGKKHGKGRKFAKS